MKKISEIKYFREVVLLSIILLLSTSCTKERRSEIIIREIENETIQTQSKSIEHNEYRYVINRRSGKVHT